MGHRLTRLTTRTGDAGQSGLADGARLPKTAPVFEAMGLVDELNARLGSLAAVLPAAASRDAAAAEAAADPLVPAALAAIVARLQHELFDIGSELALPGSGFRAIDEAAVARLEADTARLTDALPPLKEFVLPGGSEAASRAHLARTGARSAERAAWRLVEARPDALGPLALVWLNRVSDWLFACSRALARGAGGREVLWQPAAARPGAPSA